MLGKGIIPFEPALVTQSVNYHGHNLLKQIVSENAAQIHTIKLQDIDYKVYQRRQTELRNLGGSRNKEIIDFISSKSDRLLVAQPELKNVKKVEETNYEDRYNHLIPFEFFLKADKNVRVDELVSLIEVGDILYAEVVNNFENTAYTLLKPVAYDKGKHRYISDLRPSDFKIILKNEDTMVPKADEDKIGRWMVGTRLRVEVLSLHMTISVPTIYVGTIGVTLSGAAKEKFKLGKVLLKDLPQILGVSFDPSLRYLSNCIEKMDSYKNPQCIRQMADEMGINLRWYPTLSNSVRKDFPEKEKCDSLRKAQMCKWAHKNVADGVAHFKQGQHEEAFQCLNKALQIDPENVEAFVAKGALLANLGRYEKAIEDFEKSLKFNPTHSNARKYMCETLVELGKQKEAKDLLKEAEKCYSRCLELNESHEVARESLESVSEKLGPESSLVKLIKQENLKQTDDYLASLLRIEELSKKKIEEEEKPIPTINQRRKESIDDQLDDKEVEDNRIPTITSFKCEENYLNDESSQLSAGGHSLSPLSQKLANEESLWSQPVPFGSVLSFMDSHAPQSQASQDDNLPMSVFSNPPPNWPMPDISRPPPIPSLTTAPAIPGINSRYSEDLSYKAKVDQFLKELDSRAGNQQKRKVSSSSQEPRRSKQKEKDISHKKRRSRSNSSSSNSSKDSRASRSSSSSSSKSSSSSSSKSSDSSHLARSDKKKEKKKISKKSKKNKKKKKASKKKEKKSKKKSEPEVDIPVPDFEDLEEKLKAYYKKMEAMNSNQPEIEDSTKSKSKSSASKESKPDDCHKKGKMSHSLASKLRLSTHPVFLDNESESEEDVECQKKTKRFTKIESSQSPMSISEKLRKAAKDLEKEIKISSPSSLSSRSGSRSRSRGRSRGRPKSRSRGRFRSRSRGRSRRSRSYSRERQRKRSRSLSRSRGYRSRSRSRGRYESRYHRRSYSRSRSRDKYSRSRSRDKYSRRNKSRSPARPFKSKTYKIYTHDSPFSYYGNKPIYKNKALKKNGTAINPLDIPLPKNSPKPAPIKFEIKGAQKTSAAHIVDQAKKRIQQHILSNDKVRGNTTVRKDIFTPSERFGKWASESEDKYNKKIDIFQGDKTETTKPNFLKPNLND